jgi:hypothetical protein
MFLDILHMLMSRVFLNKTIFAIFCISAASYSTSPAPSSGKKGSKTPNGGDRFIPDRSSTNFELGHYMVMLHTLARVKHTS